MVNHKPELRKTRSTELDVDLKNPEVAFARGANYKLPPRVITKEEIIDFAAEFDPAFFHLDEEAAKSSLLGGLSASGFHTCALLMKMICELYLLESTSQGAPEVESIKWMEPVRPGDILSGESTVLDGRRSVSRPNLWVCKLHHKLTNQSGKQVLEMIVIGLMAMPEVSHELV